MRTLFKISQQTSWQVLGKIVSSLSTIFILGMVTRTFGESGTGIFTLTLTYLGFFYLAADFGINAHILPEFLKESKVNFQKLLGLRLLWSGILIVIAVVAVLLWPHSDSLFVKAVLLGSAAILFSAIYTTCLAVFQSKLRYDLSVLASIIGTVTSLLLIYVIISNRLDVADLILGHLGGWLIIAITSLLLIKSSTPLLPKFDFVYMKKVITGAWPISLTIILNLVYFRLDAFILTAYQSFSEVGIYNLAFQIFQSALVIPAFIMNSFYPIMLANFSQNKQKFVKLFGAALLSMVTLACLGMTLTILLAPLLVNLITSGHGFTGSVKALQILSLSFPAFFATSILMWLMIVLKRYHILVIIYGIGLIVNVILNLWLIPLFSYSAAAWVTVISEYLILMMQIFIIAPIVWKLRK